MQKRPISRNTDDNVFYLEIWRSRPHFCQSCGNPLHEPLKFMFHHLLEKRGKAHKYADYTMFRHCIWNILLLCKDCHNSYENNPDNKPDIHQRKLDLLFIIENLAYEYDRYHIWLLDEEQSVTIIYQLFPKQKLKFEYD